MTKDLNYYLEKRDGVNSGTFHTSWSSPSNIALVKYWGKKDGIQMPANPSVSITLKEAKTSMEMRAIARQQEGPWISLKFEGAEMPSFLPKITKFFNYVVEYFPEIEKYQFELSSSNSFPHSAGIASSASSMSALALGLVDFEQWILDQEYSIDKRERRASFFARLGSGSACRSIYSHAASWGEGESADVCSSSDLEAQRVEVHETLKGMHDSIVIVDAQEKKVSSRAGHGLMKAHPFAKARFDQANRNWSQAIRWLKEGKWEQLGELIEEEALSLHAMMMTSSPGYLLLAPESIAAIEIIRKYRRESRVPLYFTLDAGPNLHILYPKSAREAGLDFINNKLLPGLKGARLLDDQMGDGPEKLI